eukprot:2570637-Prymnesium_polylepis.1
MQADIQIQIAFLRWRRRTMVKRQLRHNRDCFVFRSHRITAHLGISQCTSMQCTFVASAVRSGFGVHRSHSSSMPNASERFLARLAHRKRYGLRTRTHSSPT